MHRIRSHGSRIAVALGLLLTAASSATGQAAPDLKCGLEPGPLRAVAEVLDGETVRLDDGKLVRLIGALAPRGRDARVGLGSHDSGREADWPPATASRAALQELIGGGSIRLAFAGRRIDRYDRVLAHLFLKQGEKEIWVQGRMLETGHARAYALPDNDACLAELIARETVARKTGIGLWTHAAYRVRPADRPSELAHYVNTFQLVKGRISRAHASRRLTIVDLENSERPPADANRRQRGAFRIVWTHRLARQAGMERAGNLVGQSVLVRGWIKERSGPEIALIAGADLVPED